ncbi:hypothetical protein X801_07616, partial [Opisthorchis viverrini]
MSTMDCEHPPQCAQWESTVGLKYLNLKRSTCQCVVLIYYNLDQVSFGKFRNVMIANNPIMRAYGNGEFLGISKDVCCVEGVFPKNQNIGILQFDHVEEATKCIDSRPDLREPHNYGGYDLFILPLCSPSQSWPGYRFIQIDVYEPKNSEVFTKYVNALVPIVTRHGGHVIAGTTQTGYFMGMRRLSFFFVAQWRSREAFFDCNSEADSVFCPKPPPPPPEDPNIVTTYDLRAPFGIKQCTCKSKKGKRLP